MTLRTYGYMRRQSLKVQAASRAFKAVYRLVDQRSDGRCEFWEPRDQAEWGPLVVRCPRAAHDHHHVLKPRRSNHTADQIVHLCRAHHDRCEWPYKRGRLVVTPCPWPATFTFSVLYLSEKSQPEAAP